MNATDILEQQQANDVSRLEIANILQVNPNELIGSNKVDHVLQTNQEKV